jgi:ABC-2 type transport system ATP-binding protein
MPIVDVEGLRKVYRSRRRGDVVAVDDLSFRIEPGEVVGLLGPNGAGKTTTIKCLATLVRPTGGRVTLDGVDALRQPARAVERIAALLEGNRNMYWRLTPRENIEFFAALQGIPTRTARARIDPLLDRFGLGEKRNTPARMLSKGMQQKLALACAIARDTPLLVLDEPTLGLDVEASHDLRAHIRELSADGRTVMLSSHDMAVVQDVCERVIIVNKGRVVTNDRVENLIALFKARAYRFTLDAPVVDGAADALRARLGAVRLDDDARAFEVELLDGSGFYAVVDILRDAGAAIESVDRKDPDLEEIFLRIVRGEAP